jgi:OmpA-OmpF porin, OOP family
MKNSYKTTSLGAALLLAANAHAGEWYVGADGGVAFQQDVSIRDNTGPNGNGGDLKFDTGYRAGGNIGYSFCKYFSTELDASVIHNNINTVGAQTLSSGDGSAHLDEIPLLVNGVFTWPLGKFKPFAGVGVGAAIEIFDNSAVPGWSGTYRETDYTFAWQGEAGFNYAVARHLDLGVAYKFVGTTDNDWTDNNGPFKTDGTMTHTIMGTITWRF